MPFPCLNDVKNKLRSFVVGGGIVHQERVALAVDRRHRPIEIGTFRWSSADTRWRGLPVESRLLASSGELAEYGVDHVLLGLCVGGLGTVKVREGRNTRSLTSSPGRFSLIGRGFDQKPVSWSGSRDMIFVAIGSDQLIDLTGGDANAACLNVAPQFAVSDPNVGALVLNIRDEIQAGCPSGKLYSEALSLALAAYLFKRYSIEIRPGCGDATALSSRQLARVREYIHGARGSFNGRHESSPCRRGPSSEIFAGPWPGLGTNCSVHQADTGRARKLNRSSKPRRSSG